MGSPLAPAPSRQLPESARPRPVPGSSFLPLPLRGERRVWRGECHPACEPVMKIAVSVGETVRPEVATHAAAGGSAFSEPLHSRSPRCALGRAASLLPALWRRDSDAGL